MPLFGCDATAMMKNDGALKQQLELRSQQPGHCVCVASQPRSKNPPSFDPEVAGSLAFDRFQPQSIEASGWWNTHDHKLQLHIIHIWLVDGETKTSTR